MDERAKVIDKIEKLFMLANRNPEAKEARSAKAKAYKLMNDYDIDEKDLNPEVFINKAEAERQQREKEEQAQEAQWKQWEEEEYQRSQQERKHWEEENKRAQQDKEEQARWEQDMQWKPEEPQKVGGKSKWEVVYYILFSIVGAFMVYVFLANCFGFDVSLSAFLKIVGIIIFLYFLPLLFKFVFVLVFLYLIFELVS